MTDGTEFPTYDSIVKIISSANVVVDDKKLSSMVNGITSNREKSELLMALIWHHSIMFPNSKSETVQKKKTTKVPFGSGSTIPYNGKMFDGSGGVFFKIHEFPEDLKKILWVYSFKYFTNTV